MDKHELKEIADNVLKDIIRPFGTFEKTKYLMYRYKKYKQEPLYFFTTTIHTEEECLKIMIDKFNESDRGILSFSIYKSTENEFKEIYSNAK